MASQLGFEEELLRDVVQSVTGQRSISALTYSQAQRVIRQLDGEVSDRRRLHRRMGKPSDRISKGQLKYICDLVGQLRIFGDVWAFRAWLKRYWKVSHEEWLSAKRAPHVITALKGMLATQERKERERSGEGC